MLVWNLFCFFVSCIYGFADAASVHGLKTLVVYDKRLDSLESYSKFFKSLENREYELEYFEASNSSDRVNLFEQENRLYDNLIVFPVKGKQFNRQLSLDGLLEFYQDGGDLLVMSSPDAVSDSVRLFLNQQGIYPTPKGQELSDHFQEKKGKVFVGSANLLNDHVYNTDQDITFVFDRTSSAMIENRKQIVPILRAPRTSFTRSKDGETTWTEGSQGYLVVGFQNLHNARSAWVASSSFFSNSNYKKNSEFVQELTRWVFREKKVIKASESFHMHADGTSYESMPYKVKDDIIYKIGLSEWTGSKWEPFVANDVQFELRLVDPYYRITLSPDYTDNASQYYTTGIFTLPDHHGVYTFIADYKREGLSFVTESTVKAVRHLANDEYPRSWSITNAWVYLSGIYFVIGAWIVFVFAFATTSSRSKITVEKKQN